MIGSEIGQEQPLLTKYKNFQKRPAGFDKKVSNRSSRNSFSTN
jgi:hypothetical protein